MRKRTKAARVGVVCALFAAVPAGAGVFPGATWDTRTPAEASLDEAKLQQLAAQVGGSAVVIRDGYLVYSWGTQTYSADWASASKPLLSTLLFIAADRGLCDVHSLVGDFLSGGSAKDSVITFFHVANNISGYSRGENAGEAWAYNDYGIQLYGHTLCRQVFGNSPPSVFDAELGILQLQDPYLISGGQEGRIKAMSVRDFARLGLLWLEKGHWDGTQLYDPSYMDYVVNQVPAAIPLSQSDGPESWNLGTYGGGDNQLGGGGPGQYGMNFWVNTNGWMPGVPADVFGADGDFGQKICFVIPHMNVVVSGIGAWGHPATAPLITLIEADLGTTDVPTDEPASWGTLKARYR